MQISDESLNKQFSPAGRRFNCEGYPAIIADRVRCGLVAKPHKTDLRVGAIVRGGPSGTMLRNVISIDSASVSYGWWIPISEEDLTTVPADAGQFGGTCSVDTFLEWSCDLIWPGG